MSGSKAMSYDSASLTTRDIKWLGVRPTDLDAYNIPKEVCVCAVPFLWMRRCGGDRAA